MWKLGSVFPKNRWKINRLLWGGNTTVPAELSWRRKIDMFCRGWELAAEEGEKVGLKVFFAWEYADKGKGTDFLTYGLDKAWLLENEGIVEMSVNAYLDFVRREGAFVAHAHPFREDFYIPFIQLMPRQVDAVETINANPQVDAAGADGFAEAVIGVILVMGEIFHPPLDEHGRHRLGADVHEPPLIQLVVLQLHVPAVQSVQDVLGPGDQQPHDGALLLVHRLQDPLRADAAQEHRLAAGNEAAEPVHLGARMVQGGHAEEAVLPRLPVVGLLHLGAS